MLHPGHPFSILHQIGIWTSGDAVDFQRHQRWEGQKLETVRSFSKRQTCIAFVLSKFSSNRILRCPARRWRRIWSSGRPNLHTSMWRVTWMGSAWSSHSASGRSPRSCIDECDKSWILTWRHQFPPHKVIRSGGPPLKSTNLGTSPSNNSPKVSKWGCHKGQFFRFRKRSNYKLDQTIPEKKVSRGGGWKLVCLFFWLLIIEKDDRGVH